jgi:hypothetical protein
MGPLFVRGAADRADQPSPDDKTTGTSTERSGAPPQRLLVAKRGWSGLPRRFLVILCLARGAPHFRQLPLVGRRGHGIRADLPGSRHRAWQKA